MSTSNQLRFSAVITCLAILFGSGYAQRPTNASVCDYYAQTKYGANSSATQLKFIQNVVALAFEGGSRLSNIPPELTGILRPGKHNGANIDLQQYFNGSRASTNVNNAAIGINWLDQGGTAPLAAFLAGDSETLALPDTSNQYHLFGNFFVAFSRAFGCTLPPPPLPNTNGPVSLAYAHKFMNLEYNQLGYFINQLSLSATYHGVSSQDADTFRTQLNSRYNVRCAPAITLNPAAPPQLLSLCQNPTCPLAVPVSDCAAYTNLTANGSPNSNPTTVTGTATVTATATASANPSSGTNTATPVPAASSSEKLSAGGIAGVAIGGAAVLILAALALVYMRKKRRTTPPPSSTEAGAAPNMDQTHYASPHDTKNAHLSYYPTGNPPSEMDTSGYQSPDPSSRVGSPAVAGTPGYRPYSLPPGEMWNAPVEMDSAPPPPPSVGGQSWQAPPPENFQHQGNTTHTPVQEHIPQHGHGVYRHSGL